MKSLVCWVCFLVGPCTWEPGQGVPGCRGGLRPFLLCSCSCLVFKRLPQEWSYLSFHLFTCTMGFAPIKWTCTALFRPRQLTDRAILANRQPQEKKITHVHARVGRINVSKVFDPIAADRGKANLLWSMESMVSTKVLIPSSACFKRLPERNRQYTVRSKYCFSRCNR